VIGRVVSLVGSVFELGLRTAEDVVAVLSGLRVSPRGRRVALALNLLAGHPTAYRIDMRDGALYVAGGNLMFAECTAVHCHEALVAEPPLESYVSDEAAAPAFRT
jgi:hypothetical protein